MRISAKSLQRVPEFSGHLKLCSDNISEAGNSLLPDTTEMRNAVMLNAEELDIAGSFQKTFARKSSNISQALRCVSVDAANRVEPDFTVEVRPIHNSRELDEVYRLTHDAFLERGYCERQPDGRLVHYPELDVSVDTTILIALVHGEIVGTISLTLDGPAGLHADHDFKPECDRIRAEGRAFAACWRLATRDRYRSENIVVMALIRAAVRLVCDAGVETAVFTFNPRHERIYQRILNMRTVARSAGSDGLCNAPAVFMRLETAQIPQRWKADFQSGAHYRTVILRETAHTPAGRA
jgi:hypothetical protein